MARSFQRKLTEHFACCSAASASISAFQHEADAAIVYSGVVNITIPGHFAGVYLNMITGVTTTSQGSNPGCDFNPYYGGNRLFSPPQMGAIVGSGNQASSVPGGGIVGPDSNFITGFPILMDAFTANLSGIVGVKFLRETDSTSLYGWVRISKSASIVAPGTIIDYGYQDNGSAILPGAIPAPGSLAALALGVLGWRVRKRNA